MNEHKIARVLVGIDFDEYWYCLGAGVQNRGVPRKNRVDAVKVHKKYKVEKEKKEKKDKEKKGK